LAAHWESETRRTTIRDLLILVALAGLPLAVAATALRSDRDAVIKSIVVGTSLVVPALVALTWLVCGLYRPRGARRGDLFVVIYITLTFISVLAVVMVFMFDRPMAGLLGLGLFGLLAYLSSWI
jgi:hypothetical protein